MKYTSKTKTKSGKTKWIFEPPKDCIDAGVVKRVVFEDGRKARWEIPRLVQRVEAYKNGTIVAGDVSSNLNLGQAVGHYLHSDLFLSFSGCSQKIVESHLKKGLGVKINNTLVRDIKIKNIDFSFSDKIYKALREEFTTQTANSIFSSFTRVIDYAISKGVFIVNPLRYYTLEKPKPAEPVFWTKEEVKTVLDYAFSDFRYRSLGLIILMTYEWAQDTTTILNLKWSNLDFENKTVTVSPKARNTVVLPLEEPLLSLLKEQKELCDFQEYVCPNFVTSYQGYKPLPLHRATHLLKEIFQSIGITKKLTLGALSKTSIKEMADAGLSVYDIAQVTGDKSIDRLLKIVKPSVEVTSKILAARKENK